MIPRLVALALLTVFTACTTGQPRPARIERSLIEPDESGRIVYMEDVEPAKRTVISRNYAVGSRRVAAVGEPIVGVRNYTATSAVVAAVVIEDFRQLCSLPPGYGYADVHGPGYPAAPGAMPSARVGVSLMPSTGHDPTPYGYRGPGASGQAARSGPSESLVDRFSRLMGTERDSGMDDELEPLAVNGTEPAPLYVYDAETGAQRVRGETARRGPTTPLLGEEQSEPTDEYAAPIPTGPVELEAHYCKRGRSSYVRGQAGDRFPVVGTFSEAAKTYYLVELLVPGGRLYLAIDSRGRLKPERYLLWRDEDDQFVTRLGTPLEYEEIVVPLQFDRPLFHFESRESVVAGGSAQNFDLIYNGTSYDHRGMVYHMRYKEYDRAKTTEPIYVQDLGYAGHMGTVDVLGLRIRVHDVNDAQIIYTVQSD